MQNNTHHVAEQQAVKNHCFMLDEEGREVPITTSMVQDICIELLKQCRTVKS
ncbi:PA1571 family protein [Acinetobacter rathckeae]|uniref:PA1571 family protein n=1 Tax=Acinetobacter rathckeae TaxID=2605272 RepID=UPI0018A2C903|nr:PA1571 family protein [Acinetobacter rathckeae]MBF7688658.1 hypothetical protein [Acinetobacter rathckeae]MBF7695904.1 hypothetical protein [Acinetobacter rathckeae]